ncbi:MAG: exonuclease SbcCD subunit D [Candidatus Thorarchaeota archaeon]
MINWIIINANNISLGLGMRILATADTHLGFNAGRTADARKIIYNRVFEAFESILKIAYDEKADAVLHAGDLFNRSKPPRAVISRTYNLLENLLDQDIGFIVVPGNHDRSRLPSTLLNTFYKSGHFLYRLTKVDLGEFSVIGFPYNGKTPKAMLSKINQKTGKLGKKPVIVLCHQLFDGAVYGPHQFRFTNHARSDVLQASILPNPVKLIVTGHIHRAQTLQSNRVVYPGSLERTSFAEAIEPKGYLAIEINSEALSVEFREITTFPMDVLEINIMGSALDYSEIAEQLSGYSGRAMLRLTGRPLTLEESVELFKKFPARDWPYLAIAPSSPNRTLHSLYNRRQLPFRFRKFTMEI